MARTRKTAARARFAVKIKAAWQQSVKGILKTARLVSMAKKRLDHDEFRKLVERDLGWTERTAQRLIAIASDKRLATHVSLLPAAWGTLYELTRLSDEQFETLMQDGLLRPDLQRSELRKIVEGAAHDLAALAEQHNAGRTMVLVPAAPAAAPETISLFGYAPHPARPADRIERHLPEVNFDKLARRARAKKILECLLWISQDSQGPPDIVEETIDLLVAPANEGQVPKVCRGISFVIRFKGALDQRGLRGDPHLRLIETDPKVP